MKRKADLRDRREELLRPCPYLGYDRESFGMYLMSREMWDLAEAEFRRAVWVNPFELRFKGRLALCLHRQGRCDEAKDMLKGIDKASAQADLRSIMEIVNGSEGGMTPSAPVS